MRKRNFSPLSFCVLIACGALAVGVNVAFSETANADENTLAPIDTRFVKATDETPSFQRHVSPLMGRLGCNGRACHGSFQGRGGFRLSLFGYDFAADHEALHDEESPRVNVEEPAKSLILVKPTDEYEHEGGQRYEKGGWEYHVLRQWIEAGANNPEQPEKLVELRIIPSEVIFTKAGETQQLQAIAIWADGTKEDVTPLCRFQSNDDQVTVVNEDGLLTATKPGDTHAVVFYDNGVVPVPVMQAVTKLAGKNYPKVRTSSEIDRHVVDKLRKLGVTPSEQTTDAEFLRRLRLDLTGTLPAPSEVKEFLADKSPNKRAEKIDQLLQSDQYAAWWTTRLCDWTNNNSDQLVNASPMRDGTSQLWYDWINKRVANNTPYDEIAAGIVLGKSRSKGQSYTEFCAEMSELARDDSKSYADREHMEYYWARRDFRQAEERTIGFAYTFLGMRIQCAQCHKHPFDQWSKKDFEEFSEFFTTVQLGNNGARDARPEYEKLLKDLNIDKKLNNGEKRRKISQMLLEGKTIPFPEVYTTKARAGSRRNADRETIQVTAQGKLLGGERIDLTKFDDSREPLMKWLRAEDNPFFARAFVNRVWANYFNRGIVEPTDDMSLANPPVNKPLLDYLTQGFIKNGFDMKWLHREICNSDTYQRSWRPNETNAGDDKNFSRAVARRIPAEVVYDAIKLATASDEQLVTLHGELDDRAIAMAGTGRRYANRDSGYALSIFGRSTRESNCDCDRSMESSLLQTVFLQNDRDALELIDRRNGWVDTVSDRSGVKVPKKPNNYSRLVQSFRSRIKDAERKGNDKAVANGKKQLAAFIAKYEPPKVDEPIPGAPTPEEIVREAYLRSLSREPSEKELARSIEFIKSSENAGAGARGLLWTLLNTKEFIVNH